MSAVSHQNAKQVGLAVLFIGLGWLFLTGYWWPGILFVIGFMVIVQGMAEGKRLSEMQGGLILVGVGTIFALGFKLWLLFIAAGLALLFVYAVRRPAASA